MVKYAFIITNREVDLVEAVVLPTKRNYHLKKDTNILRKTKLIFLGC